MNSNQVKIFINVAQTLSFTEAATRLYLSQSTISKNIKSLEKELNIELISRSHQRIRLTTAGRLFYERIQVIDNELSELIYELQDTQDTIKRTVTIGYMEIPFEHEYLPLLIRLLTRHTNIDLRLRLIDPSDNSDLIKLLDENKLDFIIYQKDFFRNQPNIHFESFFERSLSVVVNKDDPFYLRNNLFPNDLKNRKIFLWQATHPLPTIERFKYDLINKYNVKNAEIMTDSLVLIEYVKLNKGIGIVPGILYDKDKKEIRFVPLTADFKNIYGIACTNNTFKKPYYQLIIKNMKKAISIARETW